MSADLINGLLEFCGGLMLWMNVVALHRAKQFQGVAVTPTAFFAAWGVWNLYYYPHLQQWWSFFGGCNIVIANLVWFAQMVYYARRSYHDWIHPSVGEVGYCNRCRRWRDDPLIERTCPGHWKELL